MAVASLWISISASATSAPILYFHLFSFFLSPPSSLSSILFVLVVVYKYIVFVCACVCYRSTLPPPHPTLLQPSGVRQQRPFFPLSFLLPSFLLLLYHWLGCAVLCCTRSLKGSTATSRSSHLFFFYFCLKILKEKRKKTTLRRWDGTRWGNAIKSQDQ